MIVSNDNLMDITEIGAIIGIVVIGLGVLIWAIRLEWRVRALENNSLLKAFTAWIETEGAVEFLNKQLSSTKFEKGITKGKKKQKRK